MVKFFWNKNNAKKNQSKTYHIASASPKKPCAVNVKTLFAKDNSDAISAKAAAESDGSSKDHLKHIQKATAELFNNLMKMKRLSISFKLRNSMSLMRKPQMLKSSLRMSSLLSCGV